MGGPTSRRMPRKGCITIYIYIYIYRYMYTYIYIYRCIHYIYYIHTLLRFKHYNKSYIIKPTHIVWSKPCSAQVSPVGSWRWRAPICDCKFWWWEVGARTESLKSLCYSILKDAGTPRTPPRHNETNKTHHEHTTKHANTHKLWQLQQSWQWLYCWSNCVIAISISSVMIKPCAYYYYY